MVRPRWIPEKPLSLKMDRRHANVFLCAAAPPPSPFSCMFTRATSNGFVSVAATAGAAPDMTRPATPPGLGRSIMRGGRGEEQ